MATTIRPAPLASCVEPSRKPPARGCLLYVLLSYPLNWTLLKFIIVPLLQPVPAASGTVLMISPLSFPVCLVTAVCLLLDLTAGWLGTLLF